MEATARYDFDASGDDELTFRRGDQIKILQSTGNWYKAEMRGNEGFVPKNFIDFQLPSWYQEDATRVDAQERLMPQPTGAFLIRGSQKAGPGNFSISVRHLTDVQHFKVMRATGGQYYVWSEKFPSINKLVEFYKQNSVTKHTQIFLQDAKKEERGARDTFSPLPTPRVSIPPPTASPRQHKAPPPTTVMVEALYNFHAEEDDELEFRAGDVIQVVDSSDQAWWKGRLRGKTGLFPTNYTKPI